MIIYEPRSISLKDTALKRNLFTPRRHTDGQPLNESDLSRYDFNTLLYDVAIINHRQLRMIGPPLLNLEKELGKLLLKINGISVICQTIKPLKNRYIEFVSELSPDLQMAEDYSIDILFSNGFSWNVAANLINRLPECSRVLIAMQQNNNPKWIRDWFFHYRRNLNVDSLILYDNASENFDSIINLDLPDTILVKWPFPYGPFMSWKNVFSQTGAMNHCREFFSKESIIFNFDVDEILIIANKKKTYWINELDIAYFSQYQVPAIIPQPDNYSFSSHSHRSAVPQYTARKYFYNCSKATGVTLHNVHNRKIGPFNMVAYYLRKIEGRLHNRFKKDKYFPNLINLILQIFSKFGTRQRVVDISDAYFLHFAGITTNWRPDNVKLLRGKDDKQVDDAYMAEIY